MVITPYQILGITPPVSMAELKTAYRKAAALHHPDLGGSHHMMVAVNDAYERVKTGMEAAETWRNYYRQNHSHSRIEPIPSRNHSQTHPIRFGWNISMI